MSHTSRSHGRRARRSRRSRRLRVLMAAVVGLVVLLALVLAVTRPWTGPEDGPARGEQASSAPMPAEKSPVIVSKTPSEAGSWTDVLADPAVSVGRPSQDAGTKALLARALHEAEQDSGTRERMDSAFRLRGRTEGDASPVLTAEQRLQNLQDVAATPASTNTPDFAGLAGAVTAPPPATATVVSRAEWETWRDDHPDSELKAFTPGGRPDEQFSTVGDDALGKALDEWAHLARPFHALVAVDVSESMSTPVSPDGTTRMDLTSAASVAAMQMFPEHDSLGLWVFSRNMDGHADHRELSPVMELGAEENGKTHRERLSELGSGFRTVPGGHTGLYDTTLAAFRKVLADDAPDSLKTVIILTDGKNQDPGSISLEELVSTLEKEQDHENPVRIITVGISKDADAEVLRKISSATGGSSHVARTPGDIRDAFVRALTGA